MTIKLYHGTSSRKLGKILQDGYLKASYLTSNIEQAKYYAEKMAGDDESYTVLMEVEVHTNNLKADLSSFDDPLSYILEEHDMTEEEWYQSIQNNKIKYPSILDWETSLKTVFSVYHSAKIFIKNINYSIDKNFFRS